MTSHGRLQADTITITGTGYQGQARVQVRDIVEHVGARYSGEFTYGRTDYLVCSPTVTSVTDKMLAAYAWGIPVVKHTWLTDSLDHQCTLHPARHHLLTAPAATSRHSFTPNLLTTQAPASDSCLLYAHDSEFKDSADSIVPEKLRSRASAAAQELTDLLLSPNSSPKVGHCRTEGRDNAGALELHEGFLPSLPPPSPASLLTLTPDFNPDTASLTSARKCSDRNTPKTALVSPAVSPNIGHINSILETSKPLDLGTVHAATSSKQYVQGSASSPQLDRVAEQDSSNSHSYSPDTSPTWSNVMSSPDSSPSSTVLVLTSHYSQSADTNQQNRLAVINGLDSSSTPNGLIDNAKPDAKGLAVPNRSPAAKVIGRQPLQKPPKGNSVRQYHKLSSMQGVTFYQQLEVNDEYGNQHCFDVQDTTDGALVYYEDMENGDRLEAYCSLKHCYSLPGCDDLWICHGYYDDKEDLQALEMGRRFLQHTDIHDKELVARTGAWHSRAQVVEGIFQLKRSLHDFSMAVNAEDSKIENFWCDKQWDPATGQSLRCYSENAKHAARRSCSFNSRFILS